MTDTSTRAPAPAAEAATAGGRDVTLTTATALAIADMVGIGVFTSLGFQVGGIPSGFSLLMLWVVGGVMALCGALAYAELATALPRSGGEYNFLSRIYHPAVGFLAGWVSATVGFAAPAALAAVAFGTYAAGVLPGVPVIPLALAVVWAVSIVHFFGRQHGSLLQNVATFIKVALIVLFIAAGFVIGPTQPISFAPSAADLAVMTSAPFATSLVFVMYSYSGWNAVTYIAGEVKRPEKVMPVSVTIAVLVVMALYVGLNWIFLLTTPKGQLAGQLDVALVAGRAIFGDTGSRLVGALICIGLVSSISAMMWIGPRVTMVMGEDLRILSPFARLNRRGVPALALAFQLAVVTVLILTQGFESILDFIQFSLTFCSFLAVLGVIVLRRTQPDLPRPYRVWGHPITPLVFLAISLFMMLHLLAERPLQSLAGVAMMLSGLALYAYSARAQGQRGGTLGTPHS